jgi:hypothetical protein
MNYDLPAHRVARWSPLTLMSVSLLGGLLLVSLLACKNGQMKPGLSLESINNGEVFDDMFSKKKTTQVNRPSAKTNAALKRGSAFFSPPEGWTLTSVDDEIRVYKLKHDEVESASIVLSYDLLQNEEDGRLPELKTLHDSVITRLPKSLALQQSEMTRYKGEPRYHTMLRGKPSESSPDMIVSGYTVALVQDAFTVFAAYPSESRTLAADVEFLIYSLRPYAPLEPTTKEDAPPEGGDAPVSKPDASGEEATPDS